MTFQDLQKSLSTPTDAANPAPKGGADNRRKLAAAAPRGGVFVLQLQTKTVPELHSNRAQITKRGVPKTDE